MMDLKCPSSLDTVADGEDCCYASCIKWYAQNPAKIYRGGARRSVRANKSVTDIFGLEWQQRERQESERERIEERKETGLSWN
jgi:hypothetical protein